MTWEQTLTRKMQDLEFIASWASQVQLGRVRDHIREATAEIRREIERDRTNRTPKQEGTNP